MAGTGAISMVETVRCVGSSSEASWIWAGRWSWSSPKSVLIRVRGFWAGTGASSRLASMVAGPVAMLPLQGTAWHFCHSSSA